MRMGDENRAFHYAVVSSLVLHGLMLFGVSAPRHQAAPLPSPPPILARLIELPEVKPSARAPQIEPAKRAAEPVKPKAREKPRASAPVRKAEVQVPSPPAEPPTESAGATVEAPAVEAPAVEPVEAAPPPVIVRVDPAPVPTPAPAAPPSAAPPDLGSLAQYRVQLIAVAKKHKHYPRLALDNNWEGEVVVRMAVGADGSLSALSVQKSSGYDVLDQQALEIFRKAKPLVPIPAALRGQAFTLELRAIYNLKDQDSG